MEDKNNNLNEQADVPPSTLYLWRLRTLYVGYLGSRITFSAGAHTLLFGLEDDVLLDVSGERFRARTLLLPAGVSFTADPQGKQIACCFLDPLGRDYLFHQRLMQWREPGFYSDSSLQGRQLSVLKQAYRDSLDADEVYGQLADLLFPAASTEVEGFRPDARIARIIELIRSDPAQNYSNEDLASQVGLSGARLQRVFKDATGIPIRRYRLWHRLFVTSTMMSMGSSLTDAALTAGFSDSSHLSHVFQNMLGMSPSAMLGHSRRNRVLVGAGEPGEQA
ncbi:AraC family transcriptional regulator [Alcanivorax sp.]|uniref:AraC family transcriptional regulator n=1 Tax=Alcanivorax sp. TaxID=1872427 RepID=UPI0025C1C975|nr:AraC family transcriptional regulator [Alcanivorax sp.]